MISERILLFVFRGLIYVAINRNPVYSLRIPLRTNMAVGIVIITDAAFDLHAKIIPLYRYGHSPGILRSISHSHKALASFS